MAHQPDEIEEALLGLAAICLILMCFGLIISSLIDLLFWIPLIGN